MKVYFHFRLLFLIVLLMIALLLMGATKTVTLSPHAEAVAKTIKFDRKVFLLLKQEAGESIQRMTGYDEDRFQIIVDGVVVRVPSVRTGAVLSTLRKKLAPLGYMAFVVDLNEGIKTDKIGVLKGTDQYAILRIMHTNGDRYEITNNDIIERLQKWHKAWPFQIVGADNSWVEIEFKTVPDDLKAFSEEVYDFCLDAVDKGPGSIDKLAKEIQYTKRLFLWWD